MPDTTLPNLTAKPSPSETDLLLISDVAASNASKRTTVGGVTATHEAKSDPHTQYQQESEKGAPNGYASLDGSGTIPDAQIPSGITRDTEASGIASGAAATAVATHEAASDPHTGYQRESEKGNANGYASLDGSGVIPDAQIPSGITRDTEASSIASTAASSAAGSAVATHEAATDPHTQYQRRSEKGNANGYASLDGSGAIPDAQIPAAIARDSEVTAAVSAHVAASDPHTQYQQESEKGQANGYAGLGAGALVPAGQLGTGTPDATKYLRGDLTWQTPAGGGGGASLGNFVTSISNEAIGDILMALSSTSMVNMRGPSIDVRAFGAIAAYEGVGAAVASSTTFTDTLDENNAAQNFGATKKTLGRAVAVGDRIWLSRARSGGYQDHVANVSAVGTTTLTMGAGTNNVAAPSTSRSVCQFAVGPTAQHTPINNAINYAAALGGWEVFAPGKYFVSGTISNKHRVKIRGSGTRGSLFILDNNANCNVMQNYTSSDGTSDPNALWTQYEGFGIYGNVLGQTTSTTNRNGLVLSRNPAWSRISGLVDEEDDSQHTVMNIEIRGCGLDGFQVFGLSSNIYANVQCEKNGRNNFRFDNDAANLGSADTEALNLVSGLSGEEGFWIFGSSLRLTNCKAFSAGENDTTKGQGFRIVGKGGGISLVNCEAQENRRQGFLLTSDVHLVQLIGCTADSNSVETAGGYAGFDFDYATKCRAVNCQAFDNQPAADGGKQRYAVRFGTYANNCVWAEGDEYVADKGNGYAVRGQLVYPGSNLQTNSVILGARGATSVAPAGVAAPTVAPIMGSTGSGSLGARTRYASYAWLYAGGIISAPSPEGSVALSANTTLRVTQPTLGTQAVPSGVVGIVIYVGATTGTANHRRQDRIVWDISGNANVSRWTEGVQGYLTTGEAPLTTAQLEPQPYLTETVIQTLGADIIIKAPPVAHQGLRWRFIAKQDATGGRKITWPSSGTLFLHNVVQNLAANAVTIFDFIYDGTNWQMVAPTPSLVLGTAPASDTIANTATGATAFASTWVIPASQLKVGQVFRIRASWLFSTTATPSVVIDLFNSTASAQLAVSNTSGALSNGMADEIGRIDVSMVVRSLSGVSGAAGVTATCDFHGYADWTLGTANDYMRRVNTPTAQTNVTIPTDAAETIQLRLNPSVAGVSAILKQFIVEQIAA